MSATYNCGVCFAAEEEGQPEYSWRGDDQVKEWHFCFSCWTCVAHCRCPEGQSVNVDLGIWENWTEDEMFKVWETYGENGVYVLVNEGPEALAELTPVEMTLFGVRDAWGGDRPFVKTIFEAERERR